MHSNRPLGIPVNVRKRVHAAVNRVAHINLHNHILACVTVEGVPGQLTVHRREFDTVIVVTHEHSLRFDFLCQLVEEFCGCEPGLV